MSARSLLLAAAFLLPLIPRAQAPEPEAAPSPEDMLNAFSKMGVDLKHGPLKGSLGTQAEIQVPEGYMITDGEGCRKILSAYGNLTGSDEVGLFAPKTMDWFVTFDFEQVGYVKDDEKDKLDADKMLSSMRENNDRGNEYRKKQGLPTLSLLGFDVPPKYNPENNNLEWAIRLRDDNTKNESVNFNTKILGRHGVMVVTLVCDPDALTGLLPEFRKHMATFSYISGSKYAEYRQGDKVAKYGLTALVVGGGLAVAAKSGLLGKLFKPILVGVVAVGAWIKSLFNRNKNG